MLSRPREVWNTGWRMRNMGRGVDLGKGWLKIEIPGKAGERGTMPLRMKNELAYRHIQRQLGEIQVALRLANSILKEDSALPGLGKGVEGLIEAKQAMFKRIMAMEAE